MRRYKIDPTPDNRIEDGAIEFEYPSGRIDFPGLWIRGDGYAGINCCITIIEDWISEGKKPECFPELYWWQLKGCILNNEVLGG